MVLLDNFKRRFYPINSAVVEMVVIAEGDKDTTVNIIRPGQIYKLK